MLRLIDIGSIKTLSDQTYNLGYKINKELVPNTFKKWLLSFKVEDTQRFGRNYKKVVYEPFISTNTSYFVPFFLKKDLQDYIDDNNLQLELEDKINKSSHSTEYNFYTDIWQNKLDLIDMIYDQLIEDKGATLLLDTGKGKTVILSKIIHMLKTDNVIIFTSNTSLQEQMYEDIKKHLGIEDILLIGSMASVEQAKEYKEYNFDTIKKYKITISTINSGLNILSAKPDFWNNYGLVIYDECHRFCSKEAKKLMFKIVTDYKLALSASVYKYWNSSLILHSCGDIIDGDKIVESRHIKGKVHLIKYRGANEHTRQIKNSSGFTCVASMTRQFADDPCRTKLIMDWIVELLSRDHNILVPSRVNDMVESNYNEFMKIKPDHVLCGVINNSTSKKEAKRIKAECNVIFITYSSGSEGLNIPRITAMIFASSFRNNGIQISGRALRSCYKPDKVREFVDIVDSNTSLSNQLYDRIKTWKERKFEIIESKYYWND